MSLKKYIDIIIPTKDRNDKLKKCLDSLTKNLVFDASLYYYNIIIVKEYSEKRVEKEFFTLLKHPNYKCLNISYIVKKKEYGFTNSLNIGLIRCLAKRHKPDYIGFLHDDTIIFKGWLEYLMLPLEENVNIYGSGSITVNELDEQCISKTHSYFDIQTMDLHIADYYGVTAENNLFIASQLEKLKYYEFKKDPGKGMISLFSCLFKREAFEKFGNFDENLISSFRVEDEFCKRLLDNNKSVVLVPQAFVLHECFSLSFANKNLINDKIMRDATLHNIKIKRELNPVVSKKRNQYVVYTHMECTETPLLNNLFNYHDKSTTSFICFTERDKIFGETWEAINIHPFLEIEEFKKNRQTFEEFVKLHPHYFFKNFKTSVWVDFKELSMIPLDMEQFIRLMDESVLMLSLESSTYTCSWRYLIDRLKDDGLINNHKNVLQIDTNFKEENNTNSVLSTYRFHNFPEESGFINSSLLVRKHNDETCISMMNRIWNYYIKTAKDDKLWFNFVFWLNKKSYFSIPENLYKIAMNGVHKQIENLKNTKE